MNNTLFRNKEGEMVRGGIIAVDADALNSIPVISNLANLRKTWEWKVILVSGLREPALTGLIDACKSKGLEFDAVNQNLPDITEFLFDSHKDGLISVNRNYIIANAYLGRKMIDVEEFQQRIIL